ncbi:hypothetical protein D4R89_03315, partial [bacterium]
LNVEKVDVELHHSAFLAFAHAFDLSEGELRHALKHISRPLGCSVQVVLRSLTLDLEQLVVHRDIGVFFPSPAGGENEKTGEDRDRSNNCRKLRDSHGSAGAAKYLTDLTISRMEKLVKLCRELRKKLLTKYSGDVA